MRGEGATRSPDDDNKSQALKNKSKKTAEKVVDPNDVEIKVNNIESSDEDEKPPIKQKSNTK